MPIPTDTCDTLVIGAGPAGSACALELARQGQQVMLVDQHDFPRDKVCGDGLIPDAHRALQRLGLYDEVMASAQAVAHVACIGPRGGRVDVPGRLAVLPRLQFDDILKRGAERAGAQFRSPWRFEAPLLDGANGRVVGALLKTPDGPRQVQARWTVLATGAVPAALMAAGLCERHTPSGVALRGYVHNPKMVGRIRALEVVWHKRLAMGYGWVFPCPGGVFNIGFGLAHSHARSQQTGRASMADVNLRELFKVFTSLHAPARELIEGGRWTGPLKGAPLRCSLEGAQLTRPGLLVTGEAAGSTYAFSGEGIGKAMETGLMAADALLADLQVRADNLLSDGPLTKSSAKTAAEPSNDATRDAAIESHYRQAVAVLKPRFDLYERANRVNDHPWLADLLIWRARHSPRILKRMAGVLEETNNPGHLITLRGLTRLFLPLR